MVCIPCIVIPFFLWFFQKFIRPYISKLWNTWKAVEGSKENDTSTLQCPFKSKQVDNSNSVTKGVISGRTEVDGGGDKKRD